MFLECGLLFVLAVQDTLTTRDYLWVGTSPPVRRRYRRAYMAFGVIDTPQVRA